MTRGGRANIACVFTHQRKDVAESSATTRAAPDLGRADVLAAERAARPLPAQHDGAAPDERDALAVLTDVTRRHDAELSATAMRRRNLANADHLAALHAIWQGETTHLSVARYRQAIHDALPAEHAADPLDSAQATWLWRTLRTAEATGLDVRDLVRQAIEDRSLTGARDLAAVIDARIRKGDPAMIPAAWGPWSEQVPDMADPEQGRFLTEEAKTRPCSCQASPAACCCFSCNSSWNLSASAGARFCLVPVLSHVVTLGRAAVPGARGPPRGRACRVSAHLRDRRSSRRCSGTPGRTRAGVSGPGGAGFSQGRRRSAASGRASRSWAWQAMISQVHRSAAPGSRIAGAVQPRTCLSSLNV